MLGQRYGLCVRTIQRLGLSVDASRVDSRRSGHVPKEKIQTATSSETAAAAQYATDVIRFQVSRKNILRDSLGASKSTPRNAIEAHSDNIENEDGIDGGRLTTEWYMRLSRAFLEKDALLFGTLESGFYAIADPTGCGYQGRCDRTTSL